MGNEEEEKKNKNVTLTDFYWDEKKWPFFRSEDSFPSRQTTYLLSFLEGGGENALFLRQHMGEKAWSVLPADLEFHFFFTFR